MAKYDKYYEEEHYFGEPYPDLTKFFSEHESRGKVLDLGCGQGRDALAIARLGYEVTGVDISAVSIKQMLSAAKKGGLSVVGVVADIYEYPIDSSFDFILLDSMLHFYKRDREKETQFLERIMNEMRSSSILCIFVNKSKTTEPILERIFNESTIQWVILSDEYIKYSEVNSIYKMFIVQKP